MNIELAKRLKEAGFPQGNCISAYWEISEDRIELWHTNNLQMCKFLCSAPNADEIAEKLPYRIEDKIFTYSLTITKDYTGYYAVYKCDINSNTYCKHAYGKDLTTALAELWLWAKKDGVI